MESAEELDEICINMDKVIVECLQLYTQLGSIKKQLRLCVREGAFIQSQVSIFVTVAYS